MDLWDAEDYQAHSSEQHGWARQLLAQLELCGSEDVLDIGCGDGKVTAEIAIRVPEGTVIGIDRSEGMISFAQRHHPADVQPNLSFRVADASQLAFEAELDVVFSNAALHWVLDHRPVLAGIRRALRPGGRALLQMGGAGNAAALMEVMHETMADESWCRSFSDFSEPYGFHGPVEYRRWLAAAGLVAKRVELIPKDMSHQGSDGLASWIRTTWLPFTHRVDAPSRGAFIDEVVQRYVARHPPDDQGQLHVQMIRLEVLALAS